jgi:methylphosphotriester-DNA--protein-cysteine methyltransferase
MVTAIERPVVCPHCGTALLGFQHTIREYERQIDRLKTRLKENRVHELVAHKRGQLFHRVTCKWAANVPKRSRVVFDSREEAINAGLRPCRACRS